MKRKIRTYSLVLLDILIISLNIFLAFFIRFGFGAEFTYLEKYMHYFPMIIILKLLVFAYFHLYKSLWRYASIDELLQIFNAVVISNTLTVTFIYLLRVEGFPRSIVILMGLLDLMLIGASRLSYRVVRRLKNRYLVDSKDKKQLMIIGAGQAGTMIAKEIITHDELHNKPVVFLDDDNMKQGKVINGIRVEGPINDINGFIYEYNIDEIVIAIPSAGSKRFKEIVSLANDTKCNVRVLPGMNDILDGQISVHDLREVNINDLLGREPIDLDVESIRQYIEHKTIMVTGGGGSIGSELCRQVARNNPKRIIIFDIYENNAYEIQNELKRTYNNRINLDVVIGSVRDRKRIDEVMEENDIDIVLHAAAHKHVPLMERSPKEAVKNNIFGTKNVAQSAIDHCVPKFVLVSTDKAVNPTNVMGATKRACEMLVQILNRESDTDFVAVRFGNVLGSNGSVIPLFKQQIEEGGPVTVTHEEVTRYFMTIPEASKLVLQAGAMAMGGEIFILDMGQPVKILDLAKDLIKLSGYEPYKDIDIEIVGLRPGEKMYEELLLNEDDYIKTDNKKIFVENSKNHNYNEFMKTLINLEKFDTLTDKEMIIELDNLIDNFNCKITEEKGNVIDAKFGS